MPLSTVTVVWYPPFLRRLKPTADVCASVLVRTARACVCVELMSCILHVCLYTGQAAAVSAVWCSQRGESLYLGKRTLALVLRLLQGAVWFWVAGNQQPYAR